MSSIYVSALAAGGGAGTEISPFTLAEAVAAINAGTVGAGEYCWVKADGTYLTAGFETTNLTSSTNPAKFCGYLTTIGDNGRATIKRSGGAGNLCYFNGHYWWVMNLIVDGSSGGTINIVGKNSIQYINVESFAAGSGGMQEGKASYCYSHNNGTFGFYNHYINHLCLAVSNGGVGFQPTGFASFCISKGNTSYNYVIGNNVSLVKSISDGGSTDGIYAPIETGCVMDCVAINAPATKRGLYITGAVCYNMSFYNNAVDCNDITQVHGNIIYTDPGFNNTAILDYTRTNTNLNGQGGNPGLFGGAIDYNVDLGIGRNLPTYAVVTDVRSGVNRGDGSTGTLDLPSTADVQEGVVFDNTTKTGTLVIPVEANVKSGVTYGDSAEFTGSYDEDYPSVNDVEDGVSFGNGTYEGTLTLPATTDVKQGITYGANGTEFTGSYLADYPAEENVRDGIVYAESTMEGNLELPSEVDVRVSVPYGSSGAEYTGLLDLPSIDDVRNGTIFDNLTKTGNLELPVITNVKSGVLYGTAGLEFTGTYDEDYPIENNVRDGISFGNGAYEGTLELPSVSDVRLSTVFGANGTEFTGTLNLPSVNDVQQSVTFDGGTKVGVFVSPAVTNVKSGITYGAAGEYVGTYDEDYPSEDDVRDGVDFGNGASTGNLELPQVANVQDGIQYGTDGTELTGTLVTGVTIQGDIIVEIDTSPITVFLEVE